MNSASYTKHNDSPNTRQEFIAKLRAAIRSNAISANTSPRGRSMLVDLDNPDISAEQRRKQFRALIIGQLLAARDSDESKQEEVPPSQQEPRTKKILYVPRCLKITSNPAERSVSRMRRRIRLNRISHLNFDPSLENSHASRYLDGVYEPNM